jgi:pimeloyl-ACP methyl ester carboxylesterase
VTALAFALALLAALWVFTFAGTRRIGARYPPIGTRVDAGASGNAADMSVALAERLSEAGFRVLRVDRPGHGWSRRAGGREGSSPVVQAEVLKRAAAVLGVPEAVVVGHSLGCATALAMALDAPEFVRALTLIAPVSHPWPGGVAWYYGIGAHPLFGPPFGRLLTLPAGLVRMRGAVKGVFAPNPAPRNFIEATRLPRLEAFPLQLRGRRVC